MTIDSGTRLGRYEVRSPIGAGGMGEVYLALDTELDRTVAIKILPEALATDEQRLQRFVQEAKAASALNHPHILTIYEIGTIGGSRFIATEFIDGDTLRQRIDAGIKLVDILEISIQAGSALAAAHAAGIIHRDIKPENIMVRADGYIKVLDFGLAKLTGPEGSTPDAEAPTRAMVNTGAGAVMGTANYMSPEQAKGVSVDVRTDLWSLGAVLYEMIAEHVPFAGETPTETLSLILQKEPPPLTRFAHDVPPELERIVTKALTKDREERYQTAKDMLIDLRNLKRRVEVDAEIDRTVPPEYRGAAAGKSTSSGQNQPASGSGFAALTSANSTSISSAEYIVSGIRQHKLATSVAAGLVVLIGAVGLFLYLRARSEQGAIESIAVMPFVNDSGNADVEYLSDGMTETLISSLSNIPNISVKARSTVFFYKGKNISAKKFGEELGVQAVLQGRFVQHGDDLKLSLELVNTESQDVIWSDQFDRKMGDLVSLQSEVAKQVADKIGARLSGDEQNKVARTYTNNPQAYQAYLKGRYYWNQRVEEGFKKGIEYFRQAIELDPNYALAWSGLADSYFLLPEYSSYSVTEYLPKAKQAAENAIELDANLAEAQTSLAYIEHTYDWKFAESEKRYKKAIELNPNYATAYQWYAELLLQQRRFDEAQNTAKKSVELDPLSLIKLVGYGQTYFFAKQYAQAEQVYRQVLEIKPEFAVANGQLAQSLVAQGKIQQALSESDKADESGGESFKLTKGMTYASAGDRENAKRFISDYQGLDARQVYHQATIHALLGEDAKAIDGVEILIEKRSVFVLYCNVAPDLDSIRENPRFKTLMRQVGLTE
jgi:serine/threonine protein kinase/tetratricopeptide (TPR) repeat protein